LLSRVLLAGGGTGGHLYPGLAVAERLRSRGVDCRFVGTDRGIEARVVPERGFPFHSIRARGLAGKPWQKLWALTLTFYGSIQSALLLQQQKPQLVISTGGYVCAPVLLGAALHRIPVLMLEQNALPGKVNRQLAGVARRICLSFEEARKFFPAERCVVTGNPVREEILQATREQGRAHFKIPADRPVLLITGASQGAASLNRALEKALPLWKSKDWTVMHLTGPTHLHGVEENSRTVLEGGKLDYRCFGYMAEMHLAYAAADLVVSRAGATTLAELTACGLPAVLVPYPFAADRHQDYNADTLVTRGAAIKLDDVAVEELLADTVGGLMEDSQRLSKMAEASLASGLPRALDNIVDLIEREFGPIGTTAPLR
jgi:UDP-N-acetylglucosamine--N-acetylmuramyl-(pentapeptide) pyrophosphoryl-undecaprenol N-acetylglucosamine transferase